MRFFKMGYDEDTVKCMVFWTNFILALVGISLISIGIIYKINLEEISEVIPKEYNNLTVIPVLTIPLGTSLIGLAVFGCYGCLRERINFVILYIAILILLFMIQLTIGITAFYKLGNEKIFKNRLEVTLQDVFRNYVFSKKKSVVDLIQHRLRCCGFNGPEFYEHRIPKSCFPTNSTDIFNSSCYSETFNYISHCQHVLGTSITVLSLAEIIASLVSVFFIQYIKNQSKEFVLVKDCSFQNGIIL